MTGLTAVAAEVHVDPTMQYKKKFKQLVEQHKKHAGTIVCYSRCVY